MGLVVPEPPKSSLASLRESLGALAERGSFSAGGLREARVDQISATTPHQVFNLTLEDARRGKVMEHARSSGWRYLLAVDDRIVASAETESREGARQAFSQVNSGPFVVGTIEAFTVAERAANEQEGGLELRLIHVPALYLMSLWLKPLGEDGSDDSIFIPIAPTPSGLEPNRVYTSEEFGSRLAELAQAPPELEPDDTRGG
jgi:hypothetical protein